MIHPAEWSNPISDGLDGAERRMMESASFRARWPGRGADARRQQVNGNAVLRTG
jgi:hypothetical protein